MFLTYLLAQVPNAAPTAATAAPAVPPPAVAPVAAPMTEMSIWSHILDSDPLVKFTLLILIGFSVCCWAVILYKSMQLSAAQRSTHAFWNKFAPLASLSDMAGGKGVSRSGPLYEIFVSGQDTLAKVKKATRQLSDYHREYIVQRMRQTQEEEMFKLEQYVSFLATTASVAPFIGLFGTVWGILTAFLAIGKAGSSSLATVGPYIAEALVATAVGLFAAIPAVVAYNYFVTKIRNIGKTVDMFVRDFLLKSEKEFAA